MKKYLILFILQLGFVGYSQQKITFSYDSAGNQTLRVLCLTGCSPTAKPAKEIKEIEALTDADLLKFSEEDVISYYPNPVKEELYLQWQLSKDNYVTSINLYSLTGQILRTYQQNLQDNHLTIPFQNYPSGIYLVLLFYKDGGEKSIKIIKQ